MPSTVLAHPQLQPEPEAVAGRRPTAAARQLILSFAAATTVAIATMVPVDADAVAVGASAGPPAPSVFKWEHLPAGFNISASPAVVPIEFGTVISVQGQGFLPGNGTSSICQIL